METKRLTIVAVGGQGNLLASKILGEAALVSNIPVRINEIHGMAQRGGFVESSIVFGGARSSVISDGQTDILLGFEPLETLRAFDKCNPGSIVITNIRPVPPFIVSIGKATYPSIETIEDIIRKKVSNPIFFDATKLAEEAGNVRSLNMVLLGQLIKTGVLPILRDCVERAIEKRTKTEFLKTNLAAFDLGFNYP